jgi:hypothetical protein
MTQKRKVTVHNIKQALLDERFRESLPIDLSEDVQNFLKNPGCACNHPIYMRVMQKAGRQVAAYYPAMDTPAPDEFEKQVEKILANSWEVINCHADELVHKLRELGPGRKQLDIARWQDQITVVVNHLEGIY